MFISFYNSATGANTHQKKLDVIANNFANTSTDGYKTQQAGFVDLLYTNMKLPEDQNTRIKNGSGARMEKIDVIYTDGVFKETGSNFDYAIEEDGFFALLNPTTNQISYTRNGSFSMSQQEDGTFYLAAANGYTVLDKDFQPIVLNNYQDRVTPAVFKFNHKDGLLLIGNTGFMPTAKHGDPIHLPDAKVKTGYIESSNVEYAKEFSDMVETQRAFQLSIRMLQTSDETIQNINNLRQ